MSLDSNLQSLATAVGTAVKARIPSSEKGAANGVATLDATGKIPSAQMPGSVDQILEYANLAAFPATGAISYMYLDLSNGKVYRWSGTVYVEMSPSEVNSVNGMTGVVTIGNATTGAAGLMSSSDKNKLDGIASGANNYTLPSSTTYVTGGIKLSSDSVQAVAANSVSTVGSRTYSLQLNASGQAVVNVPWTDTTYSNATTGSAGLMSSQDKIAIDNIGATDTNLVSVFNAALI